VHDSFPGWACEGNIYWNERLLEAVEHGVEDIGILEKHRRLFWVRLRVVGREGALLVSTAHLTYKGHPVELETGVSPRLEQTRRAVEALDRLAQNDEPVWFMGDLNDPSQPVHILHAAGYRDCFAALGVPAPPTSPCHPTASRLGGGPAPSQTLDWIVSNGHARVVAAQVPHIYHGDIAPSDHWPVLAVYEI
jgi:endonuclease/exonuclease/phosphatase (EEP) superfamily protein YafD